MSTRAWVKNMPDYLGIYTLYVDSGDVAVKVVLTRAQLEMLRTSISGAFADDAARRKQQI